MPESRGLFIYGPLMPGELAYGHIKDLIQEPQSAILPNAELLLRDALPMVRLSPGSSSVNGYLIYPYPNHAKELVAEIEQYLGNKNFVKRNARPILVDGQQRAADLFEGIAPNLGHPEAIPYEWQTKLDPILNSALPLLWQKVRLREIAPFDALHNPKEYWEQIVEWEGNYLVLISIFEHLTSIICGNYRSQNSNRRDEYLIGSSEVQRVFLDAIQRGEVPQIEVRDASDISIKYVSTNLKQSLGAWFRVRNNLTHTGKVSVRDVYLVRDSFYGLFNLIRRFLISEAPGIETEWRRVVQENINPLMCTDD